MFTWWRFSEKLLPTLITPHASPFSTAFVASSRVLKYTENKKLCLEIQDQENYNNKKKEQYKI